MVRNEVDRGLVEEHVLLRKDRILLSVGSDDGGTAHALVEIRVDGPPEGRTNLVELVVSVQVRLADLSHDPDEETEANDDFPRANSEHDGEDDDDVRDHLTAVLNWLNDLSLEHVHVFSEDLKNFADGSHVEEKVDGGEQDLSEGALVDIPTHLALEVAEDEISQVVDEDGEEGDEEGLLQEARVQIGLLVWVHSGKLFHVALLINVKVFSAENDKAEDD